MMQKFKTFPYWKKGALILTILCLLATVLSDLHPSTPKHHPYLFQTFVFIKPIEEVLYMPTVSAYFGVLILDNVIDPNIRDQNRYFFVDGEFDCRGFFCVPPLNTFGYISIALLILAQTIVAGAFLGWLYGFVRKKIKRT